MEKSAQTTDNCTVKKKRRSQDNRVATKVICLICKQKNSVLKEFNFRHQGFSCTTQIICWLLKLAHDRQHETQFIAFPLVLI